MKFIVLFVLGFGLATAPVALAKKPASFALWTAKWKAHTDPLQNKLADGCLKRYGQTADRKVGECFVKGMRIILRQVEPVWQKQVAAIAVGQSAPCRKAIHAYWLAAEKNQKASLIYLDSHQHVDITQIARDIKAEPYATLKAQTDAAKKHAIIICG
jgi:hypothetical protein